MPYGNGYITAVKKFLCTVTVNAPVIETPSVGVETAYVKGVWVATVANIDFPSKVGLSAEALTLGSVMLVMLPLAVLAAALLILYPRRHL